MLDVVSKHKPASVQPPAGAADRANINSGRFHSTCELLTKEHEQPLPAKRLQPLYTTLLKRHTICFPVILSCSLPKFWGSLLGQTCRSLIRFLFYFNKISFCEEMEAACSLGHVSLQDASHCSWPVKGFKMLVYFQSLRQKQCPSLI